MSRCAPSINPQTASTIPPQNIHRLRGEVDPAAEAARYEADIRQTVPGDPIPRFDLILLGMGDDGHTASLFPGAAALPLALAADAPAVLPIEAPGAPEPRVTLSARTLTSAFALHVLITGEAKRRAIERAQSLPADEAPIAALLPRAIVHWAP